MTTLADVLKRGAASHPAICSVDGATLTYSALWQQLNGLAAELRASGIARGDRVAVSIPAGPEMAFAFLGIASCATCAPLNPAYKRSDFDFYLDDLRPSAVMLSASHDVEPLREAARERGIPVLTLRSSESAGVPSFSLSGTRSRKEVFEQDAPDERDIALILHTSGTTSRPKIVPLSHANLLASGRHISATLRLSPDDRCLNVMPLFHIHGLIGGLLAPMYSGGTVICAPAFDAKRFLDWAVDSGATWYTAVPTIHQSALEQAASAPEKAARIPLRFIRSSSSPLPTTVLAGMEATWKVPVVESYGMSEAAHQMTSNPLPPKNRKPGSVGLAAGPDVAVMDAAGTMLRPGERGEVVIRGANVMQGYEANEAANATAFAHGWFRTGDEGYFDSDGYLFLTGRLKEMINRGGEKIAPVEVDEALLRHPAVRQAVAFALPHPTLGEDLAAAVVLNPHAAADEPALRRFLSDRLAPHLVPSRILIVDAIPKGATGKIQRIGLHEKLADALHVAYSAAQSEHEQLVMNAFQRVLHLERVGRDDNFFSLGGDSLRAMRVAAELREACDGDLPAVRLFEMPTAALLGAELQRLSQSGSDLDALAEALSRLSPEEQEQLLSGLDTVHPARSEASNVPAG